MVYYKLGEKKEALNYLNKALEEKQDFPGKKQAQEILQVLKNSKKYKKS